jgi:hypothetical protein
VVILVAIAVGLLVWHGTRTSQGYQAIQSRRAQIRGLWHDVRIFALRGVFLLIAFIFILYVALRHLPTSPVGLCVLGDLRECDHHAPGGVLEGSADKGARPGGGGAGGCVVGKVQVKQSVRRGRAAIFLRPDLRRF